MISLAGNKVAVIPIRDPDKIGSLYVPEIAKERVDQGIVKYMGPKCEHTKIGMYVTFSGWSGTLIQFQDPDTQRYEDLIIIPEDFVYAEIVDDRPLDIPGLYFQDNEGKYWTPTYEMVLELLHQAVKETEWSQNLKIKSRKPDKAEYTKLRGG